MSLFPVVFNAFSLYCAPIFSNEFGFANSCSLFTFSASCATLFDSACWETFTSLVPVLSDCCFVAPETSYCGVSIGVCVVSFTVVPSPNTFLPAAFCCSVSGLNVFFWTPGIWKLGIPKLFSFDTVKDVWLFGFGLLTIVDADVDFDFDCPFEDIVASDPLSNFGAGTSFFFTSVHVLPSRISSFCGCTSVHVLPSNISSFGILIIFYTFYRQP